MLSDASCIHTIRWAKSLSEKGISIKIFSLNNYEEKIYENYPNISIYNLSFSSKTLSKVDGAFAKFVYVFALPKLKKVIREFKPDIVHAHYASSYGLLGALCRFKPFVLSVWGSDIFDFPMKSRLHKQLIKFNLYCADKILSTSNIMAVETNKYTDSQVLVTPFGIDLTLFYKKNVERIFPSSAIVIGTIKTLLPKYGIDYLIQAFKIVKENHSDLELKLLIVGDGNEKEKLIRLCDKLEISDDVVFTGQVDHGEVTEYINNLDIYVALSTLDSESFGVAIIEASACEKPVVVSNVGGLPEVVEDRKTGFVVEAKNSEAAAISIEKLLNKSTRMTMGEAGRARVKKLYNWDENVDLMISIYNGILKGSKKTLN